MRRQTVAEWSVARQHIPRRAWARMIGHLVLGVVATIFTALLFAVEPATLADGTANPAASVPTFVGIVAAAGVAGTVLRTLRRPRLAANHYGVSVRPGAFRTLLLPWVHVEEVTVMTVPGRKEDEHYMLFACDDHMGRHSGDRPWFTDRAMLREANRATEGRVGNYDLAVQLTGFDAEPGELIDLLAGFAPRHVDVLNQLDATKRDYPIR